MKKYILKTDRKTKVQNGMGFFDFKEGEGVYYAKQGIVILRAGIGNTDGSRYLSMNFNHGGYFYNRGYDIKLGIKKKGILLLAKQFADEICYGALYKFVTKNNRKDE